MRLLSLILCGLLAPTAFAQGSPAATRSAAITGTVYDSVSRRPLGGATVQLASMEGTSRFGGAVIADSLGRFAFADVPGGRYHLGFIHPALDSLGLEPVVREVTLRDRETVRAELGIPSPTRLRAAICGAKADSGAMLMGVVRDATDGAALSGVTVTGEWMELAFTPGGVVRNMPRKTATTGENGWFSICNVPRPGTMAITAARGADTTDRIDVEVTTEELVRRELFLGASRIVVRGDTTARTDSLAAAPRRIRVGDGRLSGTVVIAVGGKPLSGAQVSIIDGPQARANERGEWTLADAPTGTRMLEVRAVGYYPVRRRVDVVTGAAPVHVALSTLKAVLDTVRVTAMRTTNVELVAFEQRRRGGMGRFLTPKDIERTGAIFTSDILRNTPGLKVERDSTGDKEFKMRNPFGAPCTPTIFIDGHAVPGMTGGDLDVVAEPSRIAGIEVYDESHAPPQYQVAMSGCGTILFWTKSP